MDAGASFIADVEASESMQPSQRAFDDPPSLSETAAVWGPALRQLGPHPTPMQLVPMALGIVTAVALDTRGLMAGPAGPAAQDRKRIDQRQQFGDVIAVGGGQARDNRNPLGVGENVMFRPLLPAIGGVRSSFFPPRSARTELLSTMARTRSSSPRLRSSVSKTSCRRRQTPALPLHEPPPAGAAGPAPDFLRQHLPRKACSQHEQNADQGVAIGHARPTHRRPPHAPFRQ